MGKPVVYIELPEAPHVLSCEWSSCIAINLNFARWPLARIPRHLLPQWAPSSDYLRDTLKTLLPV